MKKIEGTSQFPLVHSFISLLFLLAYVSHQKISISCAIHPGKVLILNHLLDPESAAEKLSVHPVRTGIEVIVVNKGILIAEAGTMIGTMTGIVAMTETVKERGSVHAAMIQEVAEGPVHGPKNAPGIMVVIMIVAAGMLVSLD